MTRRAGARGPDLPTRGSFADRRRSLGQRLRDLVGSPLRMVLFPDEVSRRWGLTSLEDERLGAVYPLLRGRLLDIGAGNNALVRRYLADRRGEAVGVDVHDFGGQAMIVPDTRDLPFPDGCMDTVTLIACLNHIPCRAEVLHEAARVLKADGQVIVTMIGPWVGALGHAVWWYSEDKHREVAAGELPGMGNREVVALLKQAGFRRIRHRRFLYGLNNLFVATRS